MDKLDYTPDEAAEFDLIARTAPVGYVGIVTPDGYPRVVPMNFAVAGQTVYLHGEKHGELFEAFNRGDKVTFSMDLAYSILPSHWTSKINACATTMLYKSALVKGRVVVIEDLDERIRGLQVMMEKYQPEGGYTPMTADEGTYRGILKATAVYRIDPDDVTVRVNFRQKKSRKYNRMLVQRLEERAEGTDLATAREIRRMLGED